MHAYSDKAYLFKEQVLIGGLNLLVAWLIT